MSGVVTYKSDLGGVDWEQLKATLSADKFDNGRSPEQLRRSFENSYAAVIAYDDERVVGTARALSDGVCNAYVADVWTLTAYRNRGIARTMMGVLESRLRGQHVYLFSDSAVGLYQKLGYREQPTGLSKVIGRWLSSDA